jgi:hypothetical protein
MPSFATMTRHEVRSGRFRRRLLGRAQPAHAAASSYWNMHAAFSQIDWSISWECYFGRW